MYIVLCHETWYYLRRGSFSETEQQDLLFVLFCFNLSTDSSSDWRNFDGLGLNSIG